MWQNRAFLKISELKLERWNGRKELFFGVVQSRLYIYTTKDPAGKWEKKLVLDEYLHDASMLFDDDGKIYLVYGGKPHPHHRVQPGPVGH